MKIKDLLRKKSVLITLVSVSALVLLLAGVLAAKNLLFSGSVPTGANAAADSVDFRQLKIVPLSSDKTGVDPDSEFRITSMKACPESAIKSLLKVSPSREYKLKKVSSGEYLMSFKSNLKPNSIYRFTMQKSSGQKRSWAFQTKKAFRITGTLPRDKATSVPVNSGIEITFSHDNVSSIDNYFEISPEVEGRFEYHKKTVVFVPKGLKEGTVYTVKLGKGIGLSDSGEKTGEDYTFQFQTVDKIPASAEENKNFDITGGSINNFTSQSLPVLEVYAGDYFRDKPLDIEVFKYPGADEFLSDLKKSDTTPYWAYRVYSSRLFDSSSLTSISRFKATLLNNNREYWGSSFICFPSKLSEGHYLVNITCEGMTRQALLQINDSSVYVMAGENGSLAWVNDSVSGEPVENASVEAQGLKAVKTGKDGVAVIKEVIPSPEAGSNYYFKISRQGKPAFIAPLSYYPYSVSNDTPDCKYWSYMYLDRGLYLPDDKVNIWGLVKPRNSGDIPKKATLELYPEDYYTNTTDNSGINMISSRETDISPAGTYKDRISFTNLSPGSYKLVLKLGDTEVSYQFFEVRQYTKPAYKLEANSDKKVMYSWDSANIAIQASFFEGSPVSGLKLDYNYYTNSMSDSQVGGSLVCDSSGAAGCILKPKRTEDTFYPYNIDFYIENAEAEEEEITGKESITVFPSDIMLELKTGLKGAKGLVDVAVNSIDLEKLKGKNDIYYSPDEYRGGPVNTSLDAKVYEHYWVAEEAGEYYDFINKVTRKTYNYISKQNLVKEIDFNTRNGKYSFEIDTVKDKDYIIEVSCNDSHGNRVVQKGYVYNSDYGFHYSGSDSGIKYYSVEKENSSGKYKTGEKVSVNMKLNGSPVSETPKARSLYVGLKNGIIDYTVVDNTRYSFSFKSGFIPNMYVQGIYFDGTDIFNAGYSEILYDSEEKKLDISLTTDKKEYKPGDTVNMEVSVKDPAGKPCSAEINLSVVDEALFAIQDQEVDILGSLYRDSFFTGIISDFVSYTQIDINGSMQPEMGGEGEDSSIRYMFKDNSFFSTLKTDSKGKGTASFKLPDNLTSWRITYQGVTDDLLAGDGTVNISSKLPFFVDVILGNVYMKGDRTSVTVRPFGTALDGSESIDYTVTLKGEKDSVKTFNKKSTVGSYTVIDLGKLEEGSYSVTVNAVCGKYKDAIRKDFRVAANILEVPLSKHYTLSEALKPEGGKSLTTLTFFNKDYALFYRSIWDLMGQWGDRVDQKLARKEALRLMKKYYPGDYFYWGDSSEDIDLQRYQCDDGGISLLSYDSSVPVLSAKMCSLAKDSFDRSALREYFYGIINDGKSGAEDVAASYWGLASLNEPILVDVGNLLEYEGLSIKEKIYLGLALAEIGDSEGAEEVYSEIAAGSLKRVEPYVYVDTGKDRDDISEATSLLSILAFKTGAPEKYGLFEYTANNSTKDLLVNLEKLVYLKDSIPDTKQKGKFTITVGGNAKVVELEKSESYRVTLTSDKLKSTGFSNISGNIGVLSGYTGPVKDLMGTGSSILGLRRSYSVKNSKSEAFKQSDLIEIKLHPEFSGSAPDGWYEITDVLPSGLRYVPRRLEYGVNWYFNDSSSQKVSFWYHYDKNSETPLYDVVYYGRAVSPGEFTADNAVIKHSESNACGFAEQKSIKINK